MVQTGMTTPYSAFAQQNGDHSAIKPDMKAANDGGGGGGGGPPNGVNQVNQRDAGIGTVDFAQTCSIFLPYTVQ